MGSKIIERETIKAQAVKSEAEFLDHTSDAIRKYAHGVAMMKKGVVLQTDVTEEDFDEALTREIDKEWEKVKDLDMDGYMLRVIGEMMMDGIDPERLFGDIDGEKDC